MSDIKLLYNPSCSKCRVALDTLQEHELQPEVLEYLSTPLTESQLRDLLAILDDDPADLVRKDRNFTELGLNAEDYVEVDPIVKLLVAHPILMQRPIAIQGNRAFIARTPQRVQTLL